MKEMLVDSRRNKLPPSPLFINETDVEIVQTYRYRESIWTTYWSGPPSQTMYKKGLSCFHFLRKLRSFNLCNQMLLMTYQSVLVSAIFFAVVCLDTSITSIFRH